MCFCYRIPEPFVAGSKMRLESRINDHFKNPILSEKTLFDLGGYTIIFTCVFQAGRLLLLEIDFSAFQSNFLPYKT